MIPYITIKIPVPYMNKLLKSNKNKFHAFTEWLAVNEQIEFGILEKMHSLKFFQESWGQWERGKCIKLKSSQLVRNWLEEFEMEMEKADASWSLRRWERSARARNNSLPNSSAQKQTAPQLHPNCTPKVPLNADIKASGKTDCTPTAPQLHQKNIYDDDGGDFEEKKWIREFENLFMSYRAFNAKYAGKKAEALNTYIAFRKKGNSITVQELKKAIIFYMKDKDIKKKNGFKSFIENELYFQYVDKNINFKLDNGKIVNGIWSYTEEILYVENKAFGALNRERFQSYLQNGKIELLDERVA